MIIPMQVKYFRYVKFQKLSILSIFMVNGELFLKAMSTPKYNTMNQQEDAKYLDLRSSINIALILLTTLQVLMMANSPEYIHNHLTRSFLSLYCDRTVYQDLFSGLSFRQSITSLPDLQAHFQYIFQNFNKTEANILLKYSLRHANISMNVQYKNTTISNKPRFIIDPLNYLTMPFDLYSSKSVQLFLLQVVNFQIQIDNIQVKINNINQTFNHKIMYYYTGDEIIMNFLFEFTENAESLKDKYSQNLPLASAIFFIIFWLAVISLYLNIVYISQIFKEFYTLVNLRFQANITFTESLLDSKRQLINYLSKQITQKEINLNKIKWTDFITIIHSDIIFSLIANFLQIITNMSLILDKQSFTMAGLSCALSWMTIFRVVRRFERLVLMYNLIKLSVVRVVQFGISFLAIFMGYALFGMVIFRKVNYFSSLMKTTSTLVSLMAGDSIDLISSAISLKYNFILANLYIFTYVILFMQTIYNILTSIINDSYLIKKKEIDKQRKIQQNSLMSLIEQISYKSYRVSPQVAINTRKAQVTFKKFNQTIRNLFQQLEQITFSQNWQGYNLVQNHHLKLMLEKRYEKIIAFLNLFRTIS